jgi:hypothetical protein
VSKARWGMESASFRAALADTAKQAKQQNNYIFIVLAKKSVISRLSKCYKPTDKTAGPEWFLYKTIHSQFWSRSS